MNADKSPDLLVLFATLLALVFSPGLSAVLAPYLVIIIGALVGVGWGLKRRPLDAAGGTWEFTLRMLGTALIFTMPAAVWLELHTTAGSYQWLLAPVAATIGAVGDDWPRVGAWIAGLVAKRIARKAEETQ